MIGRLARAADYLREVYFTVDARTLGFFRICFGLHLIANVYDRTKGLDAVAFYTNLGVMPNHYALFAPMGERIWSLLFPFSTTGEVQVAFCAILLVYVAYTVGYHTKLAQILVVVCLLSLDNRNLALQNGGIVVTNVVAVWSAFLPLGARFSIDHLRRSLAERRETAPAELNDRAAMVRSAPSYARLAFFGMLINFACIYFFNYAHKKGLTWKDGSAVHWVLWQNRIATVWAAWLRMHEPRWLSPLATWGTLGVEAALPVLLLWPVAYRWSRRLAILGVFTLHCGISLMMTLGPFSYSMMAFSLLLIGKEDWALARRLAWRAASGPRLFVAYEPAHRALHRALRLAARLDVRGALEFGHRNAADRDARPVLAALQDEQFVAFDARGDRWLGGADAARAVVRAMPFGFACDWLFAVAPFRKWIAEAANRLPAGNPTGRSLGRRAGTEHPLPADGAEAIGATARPRGVRSSADPPAGRFTRGVFRWFGELVAAVLFATVVVQISMDNWVVPEPYRVKRRPELMREIVEYLRIPQGWSMFSPEAPRDDGTLVIDAVLSDGRHIDPRKQAPPDFEAAHHGPWFDDQQWCDWDLRMKFDGNRHLHPYFRDYIARLDRLSSWKQKASIRSFDVYWVNNAAPPPGSTAPSGISRQLLFSGGTKP